MCKSILLFQFGPVQEFIAQAATTGDLWAGSYILSKLALAGIKTIPDYKTRMVFPDMRDGLVVDALERQKLPTIPNRFLAWVDPGTESETAQRIDAAIRAELRQLAEAAVERAVNKPLFWKQIDSFLSTSWAFLANPSAEMGKAYAEITKRLAARRNIRDFAAWKESGGTKDFLSGKELALDQSGKRGAINLVKEAIAEKHGKAKLELDVGDKYRAVIVFDGDKMGEKLNGFKTESEHQDFSRKLVDFAKGVEAIVKNFKGVLIYAGGDDVLAVTPATTAIDCARELAKKFKEVTNSEASAGIAVGHCAEPLQDTIEKARQAEHRAKEIYGRHALALTILKRSGEILEWGTKWGCDAAFEAYQNSAGRFAYKLAALLQPYNLQKTDAEVMREVVRLEFEHALEQTVRDEKKFTPDMAENLKRSGGDYLNVVFDGKNNPQDFLNLFLCETFINRPPSEN